MANHTPGPWEYQLDGNDGTYAIGFLAREEDGYGENVLTAKTPDCMDADEANARLIAAAPDMLEALEGVRGFVTGITPIAMQSVEAAIAKAKGK